MNSTFLSRFTPSLMTEKTLEAIFVQRHKLVDYYVEIIRESALTDNKHYRLLVGPRGIGKTHIIALIYHRISKMEDLRDKLLIAWLREEEWGINSFLDLLLQIFQALQKEYPDEYEAKLNQSVEALYQVEPDEAEFAEFKAEYLLREFVSKRTVLLLMENLDEVFNGLGNIGQKKLRACLQNYSFFTILATTQSLFDGVRNYEDPFYGSFSFYHLEELKLDEAVNLLKQIAQLEGDSELESFIQTPTGRDRIKALHHLAGGNPRIYVFFAEFLTRKSLDDLVVPFMKTLDELTPYYQARMQWLSQPQRKIVKLLCDRRYAVPVQEIAQRCFIDHQTASSQLKDLREKGYVKSEEIGRESFYELREPLMRFCLEVKKQRGEPIQLFVDFLRHWYTRTELQQRLGLKSAEISSNRMFESSISIRSLSVARIEPLSPDAVLERDYMLRAIQMMEKDNEQDPRVAAYLQEYEDCYKKEDFINALKKVERLIEIREQAQDWSEKGRCLNGLNRHKEALTFFDKAIELNPNEVMAWSRRGLSLYYLGHQDEALKSCDRAIDLDPNSQWAWYNKGLMLNNLERYEEAINSYDKALSLNPNNTLAWYNRGWILGNLQRYEEALTSYDKAISFDPNNALAWDNRGWILGNLQRYEEALISYDKALSLDPNNTLAWYNRSWILGNLQRHEEALISYDKALSLNPNNTLAWYNRGWILGNLQRYEEALTSYDKTLSLDPNNAWAWYGKGVALGNLQRYEEALTSYDKAISFDPNNALAWYNRGWILGNLQRHEEALIFYDKALSLDPNNAWAWYGKGVALGNLQRYEEALTSYDKAISFDPNNALAWDNRGWILGNLQRYEEALTSYDKAISFDPNNALAWDNRGWILGNLQRHEEALISYDKALSLDPNNAWAWYGKGVALENLQRYEKALTSYDKTLSLDPNNAWVWYGRGLALGNLQRHEEALSSYDKALSLDPNNAFVRGNQSVSLIYLGRYEEALDSFDKALSLDPNNASVRGNQSAPLIYLGRYEEALESCDHAIALGEQLSYIFFNRAISLLLLNQWDEGIAALDNMLDRFAQKEELPKETNEELILSHLFNNTHDAAIWKNRLTTLIQLYDKYQVSSALSERIAQSIPALMSEMVSDTAARKWLEIWQELVGERKEFQIPLRLLNAAIRYRQTKGDQRVLLELPIEERKVLEQILEL